MDFRACAMTGHRNITHALERGLEKRLLDVIEELAAEGTEVFYTGGAQGFDTLAAREVIRFRITHPDVSLVLILPCVNQNERWSESATSAYEFILSSADEIRYISDEYTDGCMRERNLALVDASDILIAYVGRSRSGAGQTVRMAEKAGKRVYNLYPTLENTRKG